VFFETAEALLPRDTNGQRDVYEYERGGLYLISSGTGEAASFFLDATPSGNDVFLATTQPLLRRDTDTAYDIYDARGGGGFAEPPGPVPSCGTGEGCRGSAPGAPVFPAPTSATFVGVGNLFTATPTGRTGSNRSGKHKHKIKKKCVAKNKKRCAKSRRTKKSTRARRVVRARHGGAR
jgi:hypothetical protein